MIPMPYILTDCEGGNYVSAAGVVGGNVPLVAFDRVKCSPPLEAAVRDLVKLFDLLKFKNTNLLNMEFSRTDISK